MLLGNQAKKIAATMIGSEEKEPFVQELGDESGEGRPSFEKSFGEESAEMTDMDAGLNAATDKMMGALESGDREAFRAGLKSFIQMASLEGLDDEGEV